MSTALAVLVTVPGAAQQADVDRVQQRVDVLREAYRTETRRLRQYETLMEQPRNLVEISQGSFHLFADATYADMTRRAVAAAMDSLSANLGSAIDLVPRIDAQVTVAERLRSTPRRTSILNLVWRRAPGVSTVYQVALVPPPDVRDVREEVRWYGSSRSELAVRDDIEGEITVRLLDITYRILDRLGGSDMHRWLAQGPIHPAAGLFDYRSTYRDVVVSSYQINRRCFAGDDAACEVAFGLGDSAATWRDWYQGDDRRALVRGIQVQSAALSREIRAVYESCLAGQVDDCGSFVEAEYADSHIGPPFAAATRASLLQVAFATGGEEAYRRFLESAGPDAWSQSPALTDGIERLTTTAGVPFNQLLQEWRRTLEETAGKPVTTPFRTALLALTWTLVFAYFGLRSTQWR